MIKNFSVLGKEYKMYYDASTKELRVLMLRNNKQFLIAAGIKDHKTMTFIYKYFDMDKEPIGGGSNAIYYAYPESITIAKSLAHKHPLYGSDESE